MSINVNGCPMRISHFEIQFKLKIIRVNSILIKCMCEKGQPVIKIEIISIPNELFPF